MSARSRGGFCLADLIIIGALALLLVGLMLPAVVKAKRTQQAARGNDSRRQLGVSLQQYYDRFDAYPSVGRRHQLAVSSEEMPIIELKSGTSDAFGFYSAADDNWAAIAYSFKTGKYGYSHNYATENEAKKQAIANCKAEDCQVLAVAGNLCAALAVGDNEGWGVGVKGTRADSEALAMKECEKRTKNCKAICWTCNDR